MKTVIAHAPLQDDSGSSPLSSAFAVGRGKAIEVCPDLPLRIGLARVNFKDIVEVNTNSALSARRTTPFLLERSR